MKTIHFKLAAASLVALVAGAANAQVAVGGSININVPGVYGRVDIGPQPGFAYAPPAMIYEQPVVIAPSPYAVHQRPIYLYVPEGYAHDWAHHCGAYRACGQPVFFVRDQWVRDRYVQHYPHDHRFDRGGDHGNHGDHHDNGRHQEEHDRGDHGHGHDEHGHDDHGHDGDRR